MTEHPLNCDNRTALAIYEGRQTQDRRPLTKRRVDCGRVAFEDLDFSTAHAVKDRLVVRGKDEQLHIVTSQVKVGDVVWIREAHRCMPEPYRRVIYRADFPNVTRMLQRDWQKSGLKWHASIHMPRKFCRSLRRVTRVWFERVQDISEADATAEGCVVQCNCGGCIDSTPRGHFQDIWRECYGYGAWDENGWVRCIEMEKVET